MHKPTTTKTKQAPELLQELFEAGTAALVEALPSVWDGTAAYVCLIGAFSYLH